MIPREILKKIRQIELRTNRIVNETIAGAYHSGLPRQGMNFDEVRDTNRGTTCAPSIGMSPRG